MGSNIGRVLYGYCNGYFGRDHYQDKRIEAEGVDWVVARGIEYEHEAFPVFASFRDEDEKGRMIRAWSQPESNDGE